MGADLICIIAKGPRQLPETGPMIEAAIAQGLEIQAEIAKALAAYHREQPYDELWDADIDPQYNEDYTQHLTDLDIPAFVAEFIEGWNLCDYRDMGSRLDPDDESQQLLVAGELSYGDEPEGGGYLLLKDAFKLGIAETLGVR